MRGSRPVAGAMAALGAALAFALLGAPEARSAPALDATASVAPLVHYVGDSTGTTFRFTIRSTGSSDGIGSVEITAPASGEWTVISCPSAPAGWSAVATSTTCRYSSAPGTADDIAPGAASPAFRLRATSAPSATNYTGTYGVAVSASETFSSPVTATASGPGLTVTAHTFELLDAVISPTAATVGSDCPPESKTAHAGAVVNVVVCGRNRSNTILEPLAEQSALGGSLVSGWHGWSSAPLDPTPLTTPRGVVLAVFEATAIRTVASGLTVSTTLAVDPTAFSPARTFTGYATANARPTAVDDTATIGEDATATALDLLGNDTDPDGDPLRIKSVDTTGTRGVVTVSRGIVMYDPAHRFDALGPGQTDTDSFTYTITDGLRGSATARVTITIDGANDAPRAVRDGGFTAIGNTKLAVGVTVTGEPVVSVTGNLLANDSDADGGTLTASLAGSPGTRRINVAPDGTFTYVPSPGFTGADAFYYYVEDGQGGTSRGRVDVTVGPDVVWYVDSDATDPGDGRSDLPYNSLAPLTGPSDLDRPGHVIFLYSATNAYGAGIGLEAQQRLLGEPFGLTVAGVRLVAPGGTNPVITNPSGRGIALHNDVDVRRVDVDGTGGDGVVANGVDSATFYGATVIRNANGAAVKITGGAGSISILANVSSTAGRSVEISNRSGAVTLSGTVDDVGGRGILLSNNSPTAPIRFTRRLNLQTGTNAAFTAANGGTVTARAPDNVIATTTGVPLSLKDTTIAVGLTFQSISSDRSTLGIVLDNTGAGPFAVTGVPAGSVTAAGSGGTIQRTSREPVTLRRTGPVTISGMTISSSGGGSAGILVDRPAGKVSVVDTSVNSSQNSVRLYANAPGGSLELLRDTLVGDPLRPARDDGLLIELENNAQMPVTVDRSTFRSHRDAIDAVVQGEAGGRLDLTVSNSTFDNTDPALLGNGGIKAVAHGTGALRTLILSNQFNDLPGTAIHLLGVADAALDATVRLNQVAQPAGGTTNRGMGIRVAQEERSDVTARVNWNTVAGTGLEGIAVTGRLGDYRSPYGTAGTLHAELRSNTVGAPRLGVHTIDVRTLNSLNDVCALVTGNTARNLALPALRAIQTGSSSFGVAGMAGGAQSAATTASYLQGTNTTDNGVAAAADTNFTGVTACRAPALPGT